MNMGSRLSCLLGLMAVGCPMLVNALVTNVPDPTALPLGASIPTIASGIILMCGAVFGIVGSAITIACGD
jgi:hypothetical protein